MKLPKVKFSLGIFAKKPSARFIAKKRERMIPIKFKEDKKRKPGKGVYGWGNTATLIRVIPWKRK